MPPPLPGEELFLPAGEKEQSREMDEAIAEFYQNQGYVFWDTVVKLNSMDAQRKPSDALLYVTRAPHETQTLSEFGVQSVGKGPPSAVQSDRADIRLHSPHTLCLACHGALDYYCRYKRATPSTNAEDSWSNSVVHHRDLVALIASGGHLKCHLCRPISCYVRSKYPKALQVGNVSSFRTEMCWKSSQEIESDRIYFALVDGSKPKGQWNFGHLYRLDVWSTARYSKSFDLPVRVEDPDSFYWSTNSITAKNLSTHWLTRCMEDRDGDHEWCNLTTGPFLPTRLLDVEHARRSGYLRLITTGQAPTRFVDDRRYITLSHCWGKGGHPLLTSNNFKERSEAGLAVSLLPKTFRETIEVAQWFDVKWLWIDSLCILQDDEQDWSEEATLMGQTYKAALLNISADASDGPDGGLFRERRPADFLPLLIRAPKLDVTWRVTPAAAFQFSWADAAPTFRRAWVHRERQLSRRILHFTGDQLIWECCGRRGHGFASDSLPGDPLITQAFDNDNKHHLLGLQQRHSGDKARDADELYASWNDVCENVSRKKLTFPGDMPMVLSSLAEEFSALLPDEEKYVSGIWGSTLPNGLLWETRYRHATEQLPYVAPSWSWLSTGKEVRLRRQGSTWSSIKYCIAAVGDVELQRRYPKNAYGPLKSGSMTIQGYLRRVRFKFDGGDDQDQNSSTTLAAYDNDDDSTPSVIGPHWHRNDGRLFQLRNDTVFHGATLHCWCLFITIGQSGDSDRSNRTLAGLLLQPTHDGPRAWRRIGIAEFADEYALKMRYRAIRKLPTDDEETFWRRKRTSIQEAQGPLMGKWKRFRDREWRRHQLQHREGRDEEFMPEADPSLEEDIQDQRMKSLCSRAADPALLYAFDGGIDMAGLERLTTQTLTMV